MLSVFSKNPNVLILDEPSVDCDLDTLTALESYLQEFDGVLILVSHDRSFADKVTDHLFVFEGDGVIKDFEGSLSEYATTLVELENDKISGPKEDKSARQVDYKAEKARRNEERNALRRAKKDMTNLERAMDKLKAKGAEIQSKIDGTSSEAGWTVLAELTEELDSINTEIDEKEERWMELAEEVEAAEVEV